MKKNFDLSEYQIAAKASTKMGANRVFVKSKLDVWMKNRTK